MNMEHARFNMVEQQVRPWEVLDQKVLDLMERSPRDAFVPLEYRSLAYADICVPLGHGEVMMQPRIEARMLQALQLDSSDRALEVGTGSGYTTFLIAALAGHVVSLELRQDFHDQARAQLAAQSVYNVTLECADGIHGRTTGAPYDAIAVTGSVPILEPHLERQLGIGGRLFVIVGEAPTMEARLIRRTAEDQWTSAGLFETVIPALKGAPQPSRFTL